MQTGQHKQQNTQPFTMGQSNDNATLPIDWESTLAVKFMFIYLLEELTNSHFNLVTTLRRGAP